MDEHSAPHENRPDSSPTAPEVINIESAQVKGKECNVPQGSSITPTPLELYRVYRGYVEHEDELINQRVQRLILSHGGLLSAAALLITRLIMEYRHLLVDIIAGIAVAGIVLGSLQWKAINAAFSAMETLIEDWNKCCQQDPYLSCKALLPKLVGGGAKKAHPDANAAVMGLIYLVLTIWILSLVACVLSWRGLI
jgi:hypothetical protein